MFKRLAPFAGLVLLLAASALPAQEWRGKARIEGTVKSTKGEPIADAKISLRWTESGKGGPDVTTGKNGHWAYFGLAGGNWDIDFEASGFQTRQITAHFDEGARNPPIDIQLEALAPAQAGGGSHEELQIAGKKVSKDAAAAIEAGNAALTARDYAGARESYLKALPEMPDYGPLLMRVAAAYFGEGKNDEAVKYARLATDKDPEDFNAWKMVAEIELARGNLDAGKEALSKVPAEKINDPQMYLNMGILLLNKKQPAAADEALGKAVAVSPDSPDAYYYRALARIQLKHTADAKADLKKYLELSPDGSDANDVKELLKSLQ